MQPSLIAIAFAAISVSASPMDGYTNPHQSNPALVDQPHRPQQAGAQRGVRWGDDALQDNGEDEGPAKTGKFPKEQHPRLLRPSLLHKRPWGEYEPGAVKQPRIANGPINPHAHINAE